MPRFAAGSLKTDTFKARTSPSNINGASDITIECQALAGELVRQQVNVILAGAEPSVLAAKAATSTIPTVFVVGSDPRKLGAVVSYNSPGGNATGVLIFTATLDVKRLGLFHDLIPRAKRFGVLVNPKFPYVQDQIDQLEAAASGAGLNLQIYKANSPTEIDMTFEAIAIGGRCDLSASAGFPGTPVSKEASKIASARICVAFGSSQLGQQPPF